MPPKSNVKTNPMRERTKPITAHVLGFLNNPITENNSPKNQRIQPKTGTIENTSATIATIIPTKPITFFCSV